MIKRVVVSDKKVGVFVCPECGKSKSVDVSRYRNLDKASKIRCKCQCGHSYPVILEKRRYYRKKTNFFGVYTHIVSIIGEEFCEEIGKGIVRITDISPIGLLLKLNAEPNFKVGDKLMVEFNLDDDNKTLIKKEVIIRNISGLRLGVEFCFVDTADPNDKAISFYLFN